MFEAFVKVQHEANGIRDISGNEPMAAFEERDQRPLMHRHCWKCVHTCAIIAISRSFLVRQIPLFGEVIEPVNDSAGNVHSSEYPLAGNIPEPAIEQDQLKVIRSNLSPIVALLLCAPARGADLASRSLFQIS